VSREDLREAAEWVAFVVAIILVVLFLSLDNIR
jgi:hypothetical protein